MPNTDPNSSPDDRPNRRRADQALVDAARAGDNAAFGQLVEQYQRKVYALAFGILREREDAWDVAQEAFVKAYKNLSRFQGNSAFYTWLYRITYNLSMDTLRSRNRREMVDLDSGPRVEEAMSKNAPGNMGDPGQFVARGELAEVIQDAMARLSDKHRAIIVLREIEGLSYQEMAEVLKISKGTVMSRLFHARKNMQALLKPYLDEAGGFSLQPQGA